MYLCNIFVISQQIEKIRLFFYHFSHFLPILRFLTSTSTALFESSGNLHFKHVSAFDDMDMIRMKEEVI